MKRITRRGFLRNAAGLALVSPSMGGLVAACAKAATASEDPIRSAPPPTPAGDYGPLLDPRPGDPLALPQGFELRSFGRVGEMMSDGNVTPLGHDGMAAFVAGPAGDGVRLVRNHEDRNSAGFSAPIGGGSRAYDAMAGGGTTTLEFGPDGELIQDFVSLEGTIVNCAGGPTPRGTWLTCEEATDGPMEGFEKPHGYVFEVPSEADGVVGAVPLRAMGRFRHEAVACDPATGYVYQTEDHDFDASDPARPGSGFYRFRPVDPANLVAGGELDMLKIAGEPNRHLFDLAEAFVELDVEWVPIADPDPMDADAQPRSARNVLVFNQGAAQGAAIFRRLEGCWYGDGKVFFHDTRGGPAWKGHVWQYDPARETLMLIFVSPGTEVLDSPDNITVSPQGNIVICEDGRGTQFVRGLTRAGRIFDVARNVLNGSEFAGATFSPDGRTLYVNIQGSTTGAAATAEPGLTLAITGPWPAGPL